MNGLFGKLAAQAKEYVDENPDKVQGFSNQAMGFLKTAVDAEAEDDDDEDDDDDPKSKLNHYKHQAAVLLKPKLDGLVGDADADNEDDIAAAAEDAPSSSGGGGKPAYLQTKPSKPSYLVNKGDDDDGGPAPAPVKSSGKPSYLMAKKKDPVDDERLETEFNLDVSLSDAVQQMWSLDVNRLTPNRDYRMDVQGGKQPYWKSDNADDPLFTHVDKEVFQRPTYRTFVALLDNYTSQTGVTEVLDTVERREIDDFLTAILETGPMQYCHQYLIAKLGSAKIPSSVSGFRKTLYQIWFDLYRREATNDSSGFEHVFVGEIKNEKVSGMHNWVQFYLQEQQGAIDYRGYIKPRRSNTNDNPAGARTDSDDHVLTLQFHWHGHEKFVGTSFIGTSPEFEMALYTTCFLLGHEHNDVTLNTGTDIFDLTVKCYRMAGDKLGTAYPEATSHYD